MGLGHTRTWTAGHGPDAMNSPASFFYGDATPPGDPPWPLQNPCPSSLDLYGLAVMYDWVPSGDWETENPSRTVQPPADVPYELFCPPDAPT